MERDPDSVDAPRMRLTVSLDRGSGGAGGRGDAAPDARGVADPPSRPVATAGRLDDDDLEFDIDDDAGDARDQAAALLVPDDPDDPAARPSRAPAPAAHAHASDPDASAPATASGSGRGLEFDIDPAPADAPADADVDPALKLDFRSVHFDPLLALRQRPPLTTPRDVRPLDNVRKFRPLLPEGDPQRPDPTAARRRRDEASFAAQALAKDRAATFREASERAKTREPALARILADAKARGGPLSLLVRAQERGHRVAIVTRHASGVRGVARATVVAFDRHLNMVLRDVRETYTVRLREEVPREDGPGTRTKVRLDARERSVQQAFLRGEQVVTVALERGGEGEASGAGVARERGETNAAPGETRGTRGDASRRTPAPLAPPPPRPPPGRPPPPKPPPGRPRG
jgi:small nuclear ribonucleoprotein (snRNP)-like protein